LSQDADIQSFPFDPNSWQPINHEEITIADSPYTSPEEKENAHEEQGWNHSEKDQLASQTYSP
jgi:hypothetical protein